MSDFGAVQSTDQPRHLRFDGMTWPNPADPAELEWRLLHAPTSLTRGDQLTLASIVAAYAALVEMAASRRAVVVRGLRSAGLGVEPQ